MPLRFFFVVAILLGGTPLHGGFRDDFDAPLAHDPAARQGWAVRTGDGSATMEFTAADGIGSIAVDATTDRRNIWWAFIRRQISPAIDVAALAQADTELRIEARVRSSHAPRRINLHVNTPRTTDFHSHLLEFDLPTAHEWHTVSMTTRAFDVRPGDAVFVQFALMDWGLGRYRVDLDYLRVDIVEASSAPPDVGDGQPYHPSPPARETLRHTAAATESATLDRREPDANLADWSAMTAPAPTRIDTVNGTQLTILRFDLATPRGRRVSGPGLLELTTFSLERPAARRKDFGLVRVVEILAGEPQWHRASVTFDRLRGDLPADAVFNPQMVIDVALADASGETTAIPISRAVLQRLVDGRTRGLALLPLGTIDAALFPAASAHPPTLRFNLADETPRSGEPSR